MVELEKDKSGYLIYSASKSVLYLTVVAAVTGSALLTFDVKTFTVSPFRALIPLLWVLFVADVFFRRKALSAHNYKNVRYYLFFLALWISYAILSLAWADSRVAAVKDILLLFTGLSLIFFLVLYFTKLEDLKRLYYLWLVTLVVTIGIGYWNIFTGKQLFEHPEIPAAFRALYMHIPRATFFNQNDYATYLALSIPFVLAFIRFVGNKLGMVAGLALIVLVFHQLLLTNSRANYVAIIIGVVFWFIFLLRGKDKLKVLAIAILLVLILFVASPGQMHRASILVQKQLTSIFVNPDPVDDTLGVRERLIANCLIFLKQHYGFGVGAGNVEYHMAKFAVYDNEGVLDAHNWWVEVATNYGIFIFISYLMFYCGLLVRIFRAYFKLESPFEKMIGESMLVGFFIFPVAATSSSSIMGFGPQWFFFAFSLAFLSYYRNKSISDSTPKPSTI
ncbi:MAG: O-antigen ligase family protein [Firmicutes bacterium]|nr:O-antigen ligase family protein [Bacillota bacterium]